MAVDAGRQYILIVEDDEDLAEGICLSLQSPELTFVRAGTIEEAEKQRKEQKFEEKDTCGSQMDTTGERDERNIFLHFLCAGGSGVRDRRHSF